MHDEYDHEPRRLAGRGPDAPAFEFRAERGRRPKHRRSWVASLIAALAFIVLGGGLATGLLVYFDTLPLGSLGTRGAAPETSANAAGPPPIPDSNLVARQAQAWGVADCLGGITRLSEFLTANMDYTWLARRGEANANRELFSATIAAREQGSGIQGLSGLFAAPVGDGRCNAGYQTTMYFPEVCARVREVVFPTFSTRVEFGSLAEAYATSDGGAMLYLLPAGPSGCVAVKSELFY